MVSYYMVVIQETDWNPLSSQKKKLWQLCFKARYYSSTENFIEKNVLNVYDFYTVEHIIFVLVQFVVFYQLNILNLYKSAKN